MRAIKATSIALLAAVLWAVWGLMLLLAFALAWYSYAPYALENLPDADRDVIVSINFRAYHPPGMDWGTNPGRVVKLLWRVLNSRIFVIPAGAGAGIAC